MPKSKKYVVIRTQNAGVFAGELESYKAGESVLTNARRLWYWSGAASLSQMANSGTSQPDKCKFPAPVSRIVLPQTIEVIEATEAARKSIESVAEWKA